MLAMGICEMLRPKPNTPRVIKIQSHIQHTIATVNAYLPNKPCFNTCKFCAPIAAIKPRAIKKPFKNMAITLKIKNEMMN